MNSCYDFIAIYVQILNVGSKRWEEVIDHAKTCIIGGEVYMYTAPNSHQKCGVVFDVIGQVKGLLKEFQYLPMNVLPYDEQVYIFPFLTNVCVPYFTCRV